MLKAKKKNSQNLSSISQPLKANPPYPKIIQNTADILIIDDEIYLGETLKDLLEDEGYKVALATNGEKGLKFLKENPCSVAIIDIVLPDTSGLNILKIIKEKGIDCLPIMLTAYATLETSIKALNEGAYAYIIKPYKVEEVKTTIRNAIEKQRLYRENKALVMNLQKINKRLIQANIRLTELDKLKSQFLATVTHEVKTPLTSIIGYTNLILNQKSQQLTKEQIDILTRIRRNSQTLENLIEQLLDLSKIESGKIDMSLENFNIKDVIEEAIYITEPIFMQKGIEVKTLIPEHLLTIQADRGKIKQVLLNLLTNAVKFTEKDHAKVTIQVFQEHNTLTVSVADQGIGIASEDQKCIFEPFRQAGGSKSAKYSGIGLGLSIVMEFVKLHRGKIWVESEVGQGSKFSFTLPANGIKNEKQ